MNQKPPRIWISNATPKQGEVLRVRTQMEHVMETGLRTDEAGKTRPRNIVNRFEARLGQTLLFVWEPGIAVAQNPYIEFTFLAQGSGELHLLWKDEAGRTLEASRPITAA